MFNIFTHEYTNGLSPIAAGKDFMLRSLNGNTFEAYTAGAVAMTATLYNMYGHQVASVSNAGNTVTISAEGQKKGVYILRISDGKQTHAQKVVVR
ncbi:MAG: T9SS type A sorting domain-containing protein [Prevotella sp.]|nr:T9SS type A sorting domain-containing protein [Prevotella sp.]